MTLIEHIESFLGPIAAGWNETRGGDQLPFQVAVFGDRPMRGASTYVTLGMSEEPLDQGDGTLIRQELLFCCYDRFRFWDPQNVLAGIGGTVSSTKHAIHRGHVMRGDGLLFDGGRTAALYCGVPVYFPRAFHTFGGSSPVTVFAWLIPILSEEAALVEQRGWSYFEKQLAVKNPDLLDLTRDALSL
jgi:hypothetical protein